MKWYWDDSHYTVNTARLVFDRIFKRKDAVEDFGVLITSDNIDVHLDNIRRDRLTYINNNDQSVSELNDIMKNNVKVQH